MSTRALARHLSTAGRTEKDGKSHALPVPPMITPKEIGYRRHSDPALS